MFDKETEIRNSKLLLHDLSPFHFEGLIGLVPNDVFVISALPPIGHCIGCYSCWIKTPGICAFDDRSREFTAAFGVANELTVVSRLCFGGFSPEIKSFIDRSIPAMQPFFEIRDGLMRHPARNKRELTLRCLFYSAPESAPDNVVIGDPSDQRKLIDLAEDAANAEDATLVPSEEELAVMKALVEANAKNLDMGEFSAKYVGFINDLQGAFG